MSEDPQRIEQAVAAIEDLLYMGAIRLVDKEDRALLSPQFSLVVSNMMSSMKIDEGADSSDIMKLMYYSLLIYIGEYLKMPKSFMMALGNDLEKNRDSMESGALITTYVTVLTEIWIHNRQQQQEDAARTPLCGKGLAHAASCACSRRCFFSRRSARSARRSAASSAACFARRSAPIWRTMSSAAGLFSAVTPSPSRW